MGIRAYAIVGFFIISILSTQYAFADFHGCSTDEILNVEGECVSAFGDDKSGPQAFTVKTDQPSYDDRDTIRISGKVGTLIENMRVTSMLLNPDGNIVTIDQILTDSSGGFSKTIMAGGSLWELTGNYEIRVLYGTQEASTTFYFSGGTTLTPQPPRQSISVEGFEIGYQITGGNILSITVDEDIRSLIIAISTTDNGELTITLPREIIDAKVGNSDDDFFVLVDAKEVDYDETKTNTDRTLTIYFPYRSSEMEIFGTFVIGSGGGIVDTTPPLILTPSDMTIDATDSSGARVNYSVKAIDDEDGVLTPRCSPTSGALFKIGNTGVTCLATDNSGNSARKSFLITVNPPDVVIPIWVKDVAGFWCGDEIDDSSFIEAIQYLIDNDVIIVPTTASSGYGSQEIPSWIKNNACWWAQGLISNSDFASGLQYLIGQGIIRI